VSAASRDPTTATRPLLTLLAALGPALLFVAMAWPVPGELSATYDETEHVAAGYTYVTRDDFRLGPEHPPLVKQLFGRALVPLAPRSSPEAEQAFEAARRNIDAHWIFGDRFLFKDNAPQPLLSRARLVVVALGALLVLMVFCWARAAFGLAAGLVAALGAALDPNLLAHGSLATTDLGFTLYFVASLYGVRCCFRRLGALPVLATGLAIAAAFASKHSAVLLAPVLLLFAAVRLADRSPWRTGWPRRGIIVTGGARTLACLAALVLWGLMAWGGLWTVYGYRFAATPDGGAPLPLAFWTRQIREIGIIAEHRQSGTPLPNAPALNALVEARPPGVSERAITFAAGRRLVPESYLFGLAFATAMAQYRFAFLRGEISLTGWTSYFPFAFLVKTPLATLALLGLALALLAAALARRRVAAPPVEVALIAIPPLIVMGAAMASSLNIGFRHILPLVPFVYLLAGAVPRLLGRRAGAAVCAAALVVLAAESALQRPYFLSFFNLAAGGPRGGLHLLSDSNLDWGQGLPALRRWMTATGIARVNLSYFGTADPAAEGIDFVPLAGTYEVFVPGAGHAGYAPRAPELPGWVAVSATNLQGTYLPPTIRKYYAFLAAREPDAVVADSIYLYRVERWGE
jgi:hypothetical protein